MYFEADRSWEVSNLADSIFGHDGKRKFPFFVLSLNINVLLVDICVQPEDSLYSIWERFFCHSIKDAITLIEFEQVHESKIALLSRRCDNGGEYSVADIVKAAIVKNSANHKTLMYYCSNGKNYYDEDIFEDNEKPLIVKVLYTSS